MGALWMAAGTVVAVEPVVVQLKWKHAFQFAGYYAAVERGFYREAGLEVKLVEGGPETHFAHELESGRCQYAVALSSMLIHRVEGSPVVALAAVLQHSPEVLLVAEASGINNPHQMAGRTVAASPEDTPALLAMFKNEGLAPDAVKTIPYEFEIARLVSGEVAGMGAYTINEPFVMRQKGVPFRLIQPRDYGVDFYGDCLFTSDQELRRHPERVKAFLEASLRGWQYAMTHREEVIDVLVNQYGVTISREALRYEADEMARLMFSELIDIGHMNEGRWRHIGDTYVRLGMLKPDYSLKGFLYDRNPVTDLRWLWWTLGATACSTLFLGGIVLILARVNARVSRAEKLARESRTMMETILNTIPVGVYWKDMQSRFSGCNEVFARQLGFDSPKALEGLLALHLPPGWREGLDPVGDDEVLRSGRETRLVEHTVTLPDGGQHHFYQSKTPLRDDQGRTIGLLGVMEDITSLKRGEEHQARLRENLLEARKYESLHRLANGVCHHSNNILQAIISHAELARLQIPAGPGAAHLEGVLRESHRAAALYRMLLVSTGNGVHNFQDLPLKEVLHELLPALRDGLPGPQSLAWDGTGADAVVRVDKAGLSQLLINVLTNAAEAMSAQPGIITLRTGLLAPTDPEVEKSALETPPPGGGYVFLDIEDQGCGMTEEVRKDVFDPFFSTKFTGRGLGMAAALGIVKSHQGTISIQSQPGKGTTVRILLPVKNPGGGA